MSSKSVQQESLAGVSSRSVKQECQKRVSSKSLQQECPERVPSKNVEMTTWGVQVVVALSPPQTPGTQSTGGQLSSHYPPHQTPTSESHRSLPAPLQQHHNRPIHSGNKLQRGRPGAMHLQPRTHKSRNHSSHGCIASHRDSDNSRNRKHLLYAGKDDAGSLDSCIHSMFPEISSMIWPSTSGEMVGPWDKTCLNRSRIQLCGGTTSVGLHPDPSLAHPCQRPSRIQPDTPSGPVRRGSHTTSGYGLHGTANGLLKADVTNAHRRIKVLPKDWPLQVTGWDLVGQPCRGLWNA